MCVSGEVSMSDVIAMVDPSRVASEPQTLPTHRQQWDHADMSVGRALLVIADIGGYTPFMRLHRTSLAHAQDVVARLLEAMIDAAPALTLLEVEGDAAFLYAWTAEGQEASTIRVAVDQMVAMHRAFHGCQRHIDVLNTCRCEGCRQAGRLRVKFVAHLGDVAVQRVKHSSKLAGLDVILVHRMLKNSVPIPEYLLLSEAVFRRVDDRIRSRGQALEQELEGLGVVPTYFMDLAEIAGAALPEPAVTAGGRFRENFGVVLRSLPYLVGLKRPRFAAGGLTAA
jgi:Protein of unknown function (DUF2652)